MPKLRNHPHPRSRRAARERTSGLGLPWPSPIYSRDPYDPRRFGPPGWVYKPWWESRSVAARIFMRIWMVLIAVGMLIALLSRLTQLFGH